jgi:hypothetical protein
VLEKRAALDVAQARERDAWRAVHAILAAAAIPESLPNLVALKAAEDNMGRVALHWQKGQRARALQLALELAASLDSGDRKLKAQARYWPVYLANSEIESWIALRLKESGQVE